MMKTSTIDTIISAIEILDMIEVTFDEAPLQSCRTLLAVARMQGRKAAEIHKSLGVTRASFYRHILNLGDGGASGQGLNLIVAVYHEDGRANAVFLTRKGAEVVRLLCALVRPAGRRPDGRVAEDF